MKTCPKCGYRNEDNSKFCINCGTSIALTPTDEEQLALQRKVEEQRRAEEQRAKELKAEQERAAKAEKQRLAEAEKAAKQQQAQAEKAAREQEKQRIKEQKAAERAGKKRLSPALIAVIAVVAIAAILTGIHFSPLGPIFGKRQDLAAQVFDFDQRAFECGKEPVETYVYAAFDSEAKMSGVKLYATCNETGEKIELTDDGQGADDVAGDNVFKGRASFAGTEEKTLSYALSSDSKRYPVSAPDTQIVFYTSDSLQAEVSKVNSISRELETVSQNNPIDRTQGKEQAQQDYIARISKIEENLKQKKANGEINDYEWAPPYFIVDMPIGSFAYEVEELEEGLQSSGSSGAGHISAGRHDYELSWNDPSLSEEGVKAMLVALPYEAPGEKHLDSTVFTDAAKQLNDANLGYVICVVRSGGFNKDLALSLDKFRVIAINTHGGCSKTHKSFFGLGIKNEEITYEDYNNDYIIPGSSGQALVTYRFFEHYYLDRQLNDCLIYLGACHTYDDPTMVSTLLRKGAKAVVGFDNSVYNDYDQAIFKTLFSELLKEDPADPNYTKTVYDAFEETVRVNGDEDPTPDIEYRFNPDANSITDMFILEKYAHPFLFQAFGRSEFRLIGEDDPREGKLTLLITSARNGAAGPYVKNAAIEIKGPDGYHVKFEMGEETSWTRYLLEGDYELSITAPGYLPKTSTVTVVYKDEIIYMPELEAVPISEQEVEQFLNGFLNGTYHDEDIIFNHHKSQLMMDILTLERLYELVRAEGGAGLPQTMRYTYDSLGYSNLPSDVQAKLRSSGFKDSLDSLILDYYDQAAVEAVINKLYGKGRVSFDQFFGGEYCLTGDGRMLLSVWPHGGWFLGPCRYKIRALEQNGNEVYVTVSCIMVECEYTYDDTIGWEAPVYGTYNVYDMLTDSMQVLASGKDASLREDKDYEAYADRLNIDSLNARTVAITLFKDEDGLHLK